MGTKVYVGNLVYDVADSDLAEIFAPHGSVKSAQVIMDRDTGRSKGFGFVEFSAEAEATAAIAAVNGREFKGRNLTVSEAKPRVDRNNGGRENSPRRY